MSTLRARVVRIIDGHMNRPSPLIKQMATLLAVLTAVVVTLVAPDIAITDQVLVCVGVILVVLSTGLAAVLTFVPRLGYLVPIVPLIDIFAVGALIAATGHLLSPFSAVGVLPVVWVASFEGRRNIVLAGLGSALSLALPHIYTLTLLDSQVALVSILFPSFVFTLAAMVVNELARVGRVEYLEIARVGAENELLLERSLNFAVELQKSESKLRAADLTFRGVWAAVTEQCVIGTDETGRIEIWNPGATTLLGPSWEETQNKRYISEFHLEKELNERSRELNYPPGATVLNPGFSALVEAARLGGADNREWTYVRDDGSHVPVQISVTPRLDSDGETIGYLFVASDMTQAHEVARLKDEFVGLVSHELRTPLSSILGYLELMRDNDDHPLPAQQLSYLAVAERNAHRLMHMVGDLLFTAQVDSGQFPLLSRDLALEESVGACLDTARPAADAAGVELLAIVPATTTVVSGDALRLGQALDNLVSNAVKFTPRGGRVTVTLSEENGRALIAVRDSGMGIPEAELDQLFSRFFRSSSATRNAVPGVGLGLVITKAIVTAHHGDMRVESEEGVGTCFSLTLPLASVGSRR